MVLVLISQRGPDISSVRHSRCFNTGLRLQARNFVRLGVYCQKFQPQRVLPLVGYAPYLSTERIAAQTMLDQEREGPEYVSPNNSDYSPDGSGAWT